jgi:proliferating cell nuclear antigen
MIIFKAKTYEGFILKVLADLLHNNIKEACFVITKSDISMCIMDSNRRILIQIDLDSDNFSIYTCAEEKIIIGFSLSHYYNSLRNVKKKDAVLLCIDDKNINNLQITIIPKENTRIVTSYIHIQLMQYLDIDVPEGYSRPVIIQSSEWQKVCKDLNMFDNLIHMEIIGSNIRFQCNVKGIISREIIVGETDPSVEKKLWYSDEFETDHLIRLAKMAGLGSIMQIYGSPGKPLLIRSTVGHLGKIKVYLKSKKQIENDNTVKV